MYFLDFIYSLILAYIVNYHEIEELLAYLSRFVLIMLVIRKSIYGPQEISSAV